MHFPSGYSCLLFVLQNNILFLFAPCTCLSSPPPTVSAFLFSYSLNSLPPFHLSVTFIAHSDSPLPSLGASICPSKACPDFLLSAYFFGGNFLFWCPELLFHLTSISAHFWAALAVWEAVQSHEAVHIQFQSCINSHVMSVSISRWLFKHAP